MGLYQPRSGLSDNLLSTIPEELRLRVITPPASVINAYFAELYQRRAPRRPWIISWTWVQTFDLFTVQANLWWTEIPLARLNLSGKSYGLAYVNEELACVFSQQRISCHFIWSQRSFHIESLKKMWNLSARRQSPGVMLKQKPLADWRWAWKMDAKLSGYSKRAPLTG